MNIKIPVRQGALIVFSICYSFIPETGKAQLRWTENECMQYAIEHNPRIRNRQLDTRIAKTDMLTAYGSFLPSISTVGTLDRQFGRSINPQTNQYTSKSFLESTIELHVSLPVFEGFSRINKLQFYKLNKKINVLLSKVEENNLAFEVLEAFYRYCFDEEMHKLAVEQRRLSESYHEQMIEYVNLGMRSHSDLQEMKARLQSDIYQETVKSNNCHLSLLTLKELMNMKDADTLSVVVEDEKIDVTVYPLGLNELYSVSEAVLPEFQVMTMREKASRESLSMANGAFYPSVRMEFNLNTGYYDTEKNKLGGIVPFREQLDNNMNKYVGVCVSLPLFSGLSRLGTVRKEKLRLQQVRNENEQRRLLLYKEIHDTYLSFQTAVQEYQLATEQLRADSITWKESEEKWKAGMVSVFELLEKRNRYIRAKAEIMRTKLHYNLKRRMMQFYKEGAFL